MCVCACVCVFVGVRARVCEGGSTETMVERGKKSRPIDQREPELCVTADGLRLTLARRRLFGLAGLTLLSTDLEFMEIIQKQKAIVSQEPYNLLAQHTRTT